LNNTFFKK